MYVMNVQVKVIKRGTTGVPEARRLYIHDDSIELFNPEKKRFRSQSKFFLLTDLTAVSKCIFIYTYFEVYDKRFYRGDREKENGSKTERQRLCPINHTPNFGGGRAGIKGKILL